MAKTMKRLFEGADWDFNALQIGPAFENEDVWNLEVGLKQSFDRFSYNVSVFHYQYDNRQAIRLIALRAPMADDLRDVRIQPGRDLVTLVEIEGELPHVKPGDLITSALINTLIDRINALEVGSESVLRLGPLAQSAHTLAALGGPVTAGGGLWVDGERLLDKEKEVANFALLDGGTLAVRLALAANATNGEQVLEQLVKNERQGDILMAQISVEEKGDTGGVTVEVTSRQIRTYIGVIQSDGQYLSAMVFLNSIQAGHLPFTWGLYNTKLKRFVLGGASEDSRLQEYLKVRG